MERRPLAIRIARIGFGGLLVFVGITGLFLPVVPGWLLIVPGLALLAHEFVWARRLLDGAKNQLEKVRKNRTSSDQRKAA